MFNLILSYSIILFLHLLAITMTAKIFGVRINEFCYGAGPKIFSINKIIIKLIPISGYVKMAHSEEDKLEEADFNVAYDKKPKIPRFLITLSGCIFLVFIAFLLIGFNSFYSLANGFKQILIILLSPTQDAQSYIQNMLTFSKTNSFITIFAITATKVAAINLLPLPICNGGMAIQELISFSEQSKSLIMKVGLFVSLIILCSLAVALVTFIWF